MCVVTQKALGMCNVCKCVYDSILYRFIYWTIWLGWNEKDRERKSGSEGSADSRLTLKWKRAVECEGVEARLELYGRRDCGGGGTGQCIHNKSDVRVLVLRSDGAKGFSQFTLSH